VNIFVKVTRAKVIRRQGASLRTGSSDPQIFTSRGGGRERLCNTVLKSISTYTAALRCDSERWGEIVNDSAALRVAIDIETLSPIVFLYLSQRAAQRSRSGNRPLRGTT